MTVAQNYAGFPLAVHLLAAPLFAAPPSPTILNVYTTAETTTSAQVVWNTDIASDSLLQYSTTNPIPPGAPSIYLAAPVSVHEIELTGLSAGTLYHFRVTSCARRRCSSATGSFDTYPSCPDEVPPIAGAWQRVDSPNVDGAAKVSNQLLGVASVSQSDAWAVGWAQDPLAPPYVKQTLVEHFDGRAWTIVPSPNRENHYFNMLHAVSGTSDGDVWAVGVSHDGTLPSRTLIEHWDGAQWSIVASPSPESELNELRGVAAISVDNAWAVGFRSGVQTVEPIETLILHWDGTSWTQVASPNVPGGANQLFSITALSAKDIWAVGAAAGAPLAVHWNGSAWSVVPVNRNLGLSAEKLTGIAGASGKDLWAVGDGRGILTNQVFATIRHWDGTRWTDKVCRAPSASNPPDGYEGGGPDAYYTGVAAAAGNDAWTVGVRGSGPVIFHRDDEAWTQVTHPRAFPNAAVLRAVTTSGDGGAWAVGFLIEVDPSGSTSPERTLVHRYIP